MPNGEWGVRMTPDGKVPDAALQLISEKHEALFGAEPSSVTSTTEMVAPTAPPEITHATVEQPVITTSEAPVLKDVLSQPTINSADIAAHPELFDKLTHVAPNVELHTYLTEGLGMPERVWIESVQPFIEEQLNKPNPLYTANFYESPQGIRFTGNGQLPDKLVAELLQSIPFATRNSFTLVG
jgi:hypothetical protein